MAVKSDKEQAPEELETANGGLLDPPQEGSEFFEGEGKSYTVTKDVNPVQLLHEVEEKLGDRDRFQVIVQGAKPGRKVSEENPLTIHVHGEGADMRKVRGVVESHTPDPHFGVSQEDQEVDALRKKLQGGKDLTVAELNKVVRSLI